MSRYPAILERVLAPQRGGFPPDLARQVLQLTFAPEDVERYVELSAKAQDGALTEDERAELEDYLSVNDFLMILKAKAEASLHQQNPAA